MRFNITRSDPVPEVAATILADLPVAGALPRSTEFYLEAASRMVTYLAVTEDEVPVGILLLEPHFRETAEVHLMAVRTNYLRQGLGRRLLAAAESDARAFGTKLLEVKVIGPSDPQAWAAASRSFYQDTGFWPVEEFPGLWEGRPALVMVKAV